MKLKPIYTLLLALYILMSLLIPLASYNKLLFAALVAIYGVYILFSKKEKKFECLKFTIAPIVIIGIFVYGYVKGMFGGADMALARQFLLGTSMFALIYPIDEFEIDMNTLLKIVAKIYIFAFFIYAVYAINIKEYDLPAVINQAAHLLDNGVTRAIGKTLQDRGSGLSKYRNFFGGRGMQIYLGSTPFLLVLTDILFVDFLKNKKWSNLIWVGLVVALTFTTGSRTLILLIPASLCLLIWLNLDRKKQIFAAVIIGILGVAAFVFLLNHSTFFSMSERSNAVKAGHILSYFEQLNLKQALIGDGLASFYYSSGTKYELAHTEITFMDHCRWFGIPFAILVWGSLVVPKIRNNWKDWKNWKVWELKEELVILLLYMVFAQTNPVLFNSFGLTVVLWYWNCLFMKSKKEE